MAGLMDSGSACDPGDAAANLPGRPANRPHATAHSPDPRTWPLLGFYMDCIEFGDLDREAGRPRDRPDGQWLGVARPVTRAIRSPICLDARQQASRHCPQSWPSH